MIGAENKRRRGVYIHNILVAEHVRAVSAIGLGINNILVDLGQNLVLWEQEATGRMEEEQHLQRKSQNKL